MKVIERKYNVIYKTTCLITNKWYIGMHSTDDINDGYVGSGTHLWRSINKYGKENHVTEILEYLPNRELLALREEAILTVDIRKDPLCMNIAVGGIGHYPGYKFSAEAKQNMSLLRKPINKEIRAKIGKAHKERHAVNRKQRIKEFIEQPFSMTREEIINELILPNGNLNKNTTRNLKYREINLRITRNAQKARK